MYMIFNYLQILYGGFVRTETTNMNAKIVENVQILLFRHYKMWWSIWLLVSRVAVARAMLRWAL